MARILCLETATRNCSVAVAEDGVLKGAMELQTSGYSHAEKLHPFIHDLLQDLQLKVSDLDAVAISKGPGSYTGLRIGTSAAKGLCVPLQIPLIAIATPEHMARGIFRKYPEADLAIPMLDARRMEVYCAAYTHSGENVMEIDARIIDQDPFLHLKGSLVFGGDGTAKCADQLAGEHRIFDGGIKASAIDMVEIAESRFVAKAFEDVAYFEPYYLKDFVAGKPKKLL